MIGGLCDILEVFKHGKMRSGEMMQFIDCRMSEPSSQFDKCLAMAKIEQPALVCTPCQHRREGAHCIERAGGFSSQGGRRRVAG